MNLKNKELVKSIETIMDTFSGGDNVKFMAFKIYMEKLDSDPTNPSRELELIVTRFSRFLEICEREIFPR